jgi:hypothetical protein
LLSGGRIGSSLSALRFGFSGLALFYSGSLSSSSSGSLSLGLSLGLGSSGSSYFSGFSTSLGLARLGNFDSSLLGGRSLSCRSSSGSSLVGSSDGSGVGTCAHRTVNVTGVVILKEGNVVLWGYFWDLLAFGLSRVLEVGGVCGYIQSREHSNHGGEGQDAQNGHADGLFD